MINLLTKLIDSKTLKCPNCHGTNLIMSEKTISCSGCNSSFNLVENTADLFNDYLDEEHDANVQFPNNLVNSLIDKLALEPTDETYTRIEEILQFTAKRARNTELSAEINEIWDRFGIDHSELDYPVKPVVRPTNELNADYNISFVRHYVKSPLPANAVISRNIRITNDGLSTWSSNTAQPLRLSYHWFDFNGNCILFDGVRTNFPIDIEPSRAITIPLKMVTPPIPGMYILTVSLVHETVKWIDEKVLRIPVQIAFIARNRELDVVNHTNRSYSYAEDHRVGAEMLRVYLDKNYKNRQIRLLEVGGGPHPQTAFLPGINADIVNTDISMPLLMLGTLWFSTHLPEITERLSFVCCDANNPPFAENSFDGIVMFCTLHHFPEPEKVLTKLGGLINNDGFIAVICEPIGADLTHSIAIRDLSKGINEQVFSLDEYFQIFKKSRLYPVLAQADGHSLKVILKKEAREIPVTGNRLPVRWVSFIYDTFGYADEARNMVLHLNEENNQIKVHPVSRQQDVLGLLDEETRKRFDTLVRSEERLDSVNIIWLPVNWLATTRQAYKPNAVANVMRTMFETDRIPADWVTACNNMDEIWVPSQFNVETFAHAGVSLNKLFVIPGGIDSGKFSPDITPMSWPDKKGFNFLAVFEWTDRKGWEVLLGAYLTEFKKKDDVALVLKVSVPGITSIEKIQRQIADYIYSLGLRPENSPAFSLIFRDFTSGEMAALYAACDAFVLPSRGEGWGRPYMEAMGMGLPTIGTRWSGQLAFMNDDNSYLIEIDGLEDVPSTVDIYLYRGHRWARPSLEHTMALMRQVYENREQAWEKGSKARRDIVEKWSWEKAAEKVEQRLEPYRR